MIKNSRGFYLPSDYVTEAELLANGSSGRELASALSASTQTSIAAATLITNLSITFDVVDRPVWVTVYLPAVSISSAAAFFSLSIVNGVNTTPIVYSFTGSIASGSFFPCTVMERISTPGTYTRRAVLARLGGTGTINNNFDAGTVSSIRAVEA